MGDRPSGIRVIKLLQGGTTGINPKAIGGYVSGVDFPTSLIYGKLLPPSTTSTGGNKTHKRHYKRHTKTHKRHTKTHKKYNKTHKRHKTTRKQKRHKKHNKTNKK